MKELQLAVGQVIKNYKALCEMLEVKPTKGAYRKYHIAELDRYCTYHKEGQKFIVDSIHSEVREKVDNRHNNNTKYMDSLKILLCQKDYTGTMYGIMSDLLLMGDIDDLRPSICNKKSVNKYLVALKRDVTAKVNSALDRLQKDGKIVYDRFYEVHPVNGNKRHATEDETKVIIEEKSILLGEFGYENEGKLALNLEKLSKFYELLNERLTRKIGVKNAYFLYSIQTKVDALDWEYAVGDAVIVAERDKFRKLMENRMWHVLTKDYSIRKHRGLRTKDYTNIVGEITLGHNAPLHNDYVVAKHNEIFGANRELDIDDNMEDTTEECDKVEQVSDTLSDTDNNTDSDTDNNTDSDTDNNTDNNISGDTLSDTDNSTAVIRNEDGEYVFKYLEKLEYGRVLVW